MTRTRTSRPLSACKWLLCLLALSACSRLEIGDMKEKGQQTPATDTLSIAEALSVAEALKAEQGKEVVVAGYYVGFVNGTALSNVVWAQSLEKANTNLLLADDPTLYDEDKSLPVELSTARGIRSQLNTFDNPALFRQRLLIRGTVSPYFGVNGLKSVTAWRLAGDDEWEEQDQQDKDDDGPEGEGDNPAPQPDTGEGDKPQPVVTGLPRILPTGSARRGR